MGLDISLVDTEKSIKYPTDWNDEQQLQEYKNSITSSRRYPEHTWTPVYLRSSYNDLGFNHVVHNITGMDLYYVFEPGDEYEVAPDWEACLERAQRLLEALKKQVAEFPFSCSMMFAERFKNLQDDRPKTDKQALDLFRKVLESVPVPYSFSDASGEYHLDEPLPVSALIRGKGFLGNCIYIVYKNKELKWYVEAAEILVYEFIPLGIQYKDTARLCWSG